MPCGLWISSSIWRLRDRVHAERIEVEPARLLVEQAQHDAFAVAGRDRRDADVDRAAGDAQRDAAVLRQALLGDVEPRHDLDARDDQRRHRALGLQHLAQHAVDAEADHESVLERLDVDVGGVLLDRLRQQRVDQADDRRLVLALEQVGRLGHVLREVGEVGLLLEPAHRVHRRAGAGLVRFAQQRLERSTVTRSSSSARRRWRRTSASASGEAPSRTTTSASVSVMPRTSTPWRFANANGSGRSGSVTRPAAARIAASVAAVFTGSTREATRAAAARQVAASARVAGCRRRTAWSQAARARCSTGFCVGGAGLVIDSHAFGRRVARRRGLPRRVQQFRRHQRLQRGQRRLPLRRHQRDLALVDAAVAASRM